MLITMKQPVTALFACSAAALATPTLAHTQEQPHDEPAIQNTPADADEPTLDELLGLDGTGEDMPDEPGTDKPQPDQSDDTGDGTTDPELTRDLDKRLSGEEAATQFAQAIQEMEDVAIRLDEQHDPGIDTQRMQDEIILKLEQIISSAEKRQSQQQQQGQPQDGQPRQADQGGQPQPGQQPGDQQGQQPGQQQGQQPGQQQGDQEGQQPGEQQGQPGQQPGNNSSDGQARQGSVRNQELTMQELRDGEWGNLPPRLRDELAESLSETFNPVYRAATEAFYRRIAELSRQQAEGDE